MARKRVTRKNADDRLRSLERKAFATQDSEDILRYWRACLQVGELPKESVVIPDYGKLVIHAWTLYPKQYESIYSRRWSPELDGREREKLGVLLANIPRGVINSGNVTGSHPRVIYKERTDYMGSMKDMIEALIFMYESGVRYEG